MKKQPKIDVPPSMWEKFFNLLSAILIIALWVYAAQAYSTLPKEIPTHFDGSGVPDEWGSKKTIFIMPGIALITFVLMYFASKKPHLFNYPMKVTEENAHRLYPLAKTSMAIINFEMVLLFSYITWGMIQSAKDDSGLGVGFVIAALLIPLITSIIFMVKMNKVK
ncbi:DUF1648 domain-containing protein [Virgibacillus kekensis]|uniref:DUF1648 domain-containing protein n=1 Tax=Virgibacillus kekensis TaxID=202261 RepID=A0ABV9DFH0_9BACI